MKKKNNKDSFMLIGMSTFTRYLAEYLYERNFEVIAVDLDEARIEKIRPYVTKGIIGNAVDIDFLKKAGVEDVGAVVVSLGSKTDNSLIVIYNLHEMGIENIYVKVVEADHAKIVKKLGADEVIFPEQESAMRLAQRIDNPNVLDYIPLTGDYSIIDWTPTEDFIGQSLGKLNLKAEYGVQVVSIEDSKQEVKLIPKANHVIKKDDVLVVIGKNEALEKLKDKS